MHATTVTHASVLDIYMPMQIGLREDDSTGSITDSLNILSHVEHKILPCKVWNNLLRCTVIIHNPLGLGQ